MSNRQRFKSPSSRNKEKTAPIIRKESAAVAWIQQLSFCVRETMGRIAKEYTTKLPQRPPAIEATAFYLNLKKNRYGDIPCLEKTRVKLVDNEEGDYIHANFVQMPHDSVRYILTQAPMPHTLNDFWAMVWQEGVSQIVCLTKILEQGKTKTHEYWPTSCGKQYHQHYNHIHVRNCGVKNAEHYALTMLEMCNGRSRQTRKVLHYLYLDWPDHKVPVCTHNFLHFIDDLELQETQGSSSEPSTVLVHCSAGVGRSGSLLALRSLVNAVKSGEPPDVFTTVANLRYQRAMSVQGAEQYLFIYYAMVVYILENSDMAENEKTELLEKLKPMRTCSTNSHKGKTSDFRQTREEGPSPTPAPDGGTGTVSKKTKRKSRKPTANKV